MGGHQTNLTKLAPGITSLVHILTKLKKIINHKISVLKVLNF